MRVTQLRIFLQSHFEKANTFLIFADLIIAVAQVEQALPAFRVHFYLFDQPGDLVPVGLQMVTNQIIVFNQAQGF